MEVCKEKNISAQTFHRWKRQFGLMEIPEARRLKELEKENSGLKKMLAGSRLKNRVREIVNAKKMVSPGHQRQLATLVVRDGVGSGRAACPLPRRGTLHDGLSTAAPCARRPRLIARTPELSALHPPVWLPPDRPPCCAKKAGPRVASRCRDSAAQQACACRHRGSGGGAVASFHRLAHPGDASRAGVDVGLRGGRHRAWGCVAHAHGPR